MRVLLRLTLLTLLAGVAWQALEPGLAAADFPPKSGLTIYTGAVAPVPRGALGRVNIIFNEADNELSGYVCAVQGLVIEEPAGTTRIDAFSADSAAFNQLPAVNALLIANDFAPTTLDYLEQVIDWVRFGNFCFYAFSVDNVINKCFIVQITTPGTARANPDPGIVGVETWFWVEGILGGDPSYTQLPAGHPRIIGQGNRYAVNLAADGDGIWDGAAPGELGATTADGIWLDTADRYGWGCDKQGVGMMLNWRYWPRSSDLDPDGSEAVARIPRFELGGRWRQQAWDQIRSELHGPDPGDTPTIQLRAVNDQVGLVPQYTTFAGTLHLEEYQWSFTGVPDLNVPSTWLKLEGTPYDKGGAGVKPLNSNFDDPASYSGAIRHTYDYHGLFNARVLVNRKLIGTLTYHYFETYHYDDRYTASDYAPVDRGWGWYRCSPIRFESLGHYRGEWRAPQLCTNEQEREHSWEVGIGTPDPPDPPVECEQPDPPDPPVECEQPEPPPESCSYVFLEYINGSLDWTSGAETSRCSYSYSDAGSRQAYSFTHSGGKGCPSEPARHATYNSSKNPGNCIILRRHKHQETLTARVRNIESTADLPVEPTYHTTLDGYPVRRVQPYLVPNQ